MTGCQLAVEGSRRHRSPEARKRSGPPCGLPPRRPGCPGFPAGRSSRPRRPTGRQSPLGGRAPPRRALGPAPLWAATPPKAALPAAGCPISSQSFSSPKPLSSTQGRAPGTSFILQLSPNPAAMSIPPRQAFLPEHGKQNLPISRPGLHYVK